ncbi:MAG TPA: hypothetical protein VK654_12770, partial [Nitrospirota bacterium]|nr:hypothetical protein [Nitrospirota bacterium]
MKKLSIVFLIVLTASTLYAAPPLNKSISEPPEYPGRTLRQRYAEALSPAMRYLASAPTLTIFPATVNLLFLRVDFPADTDTTTTGTGVWTDYASLPYTQVTGSADYWVNRAKQKFIDYWTEVSYGALTVNIDISTSVYRLPSTMANYGTETYEAIQNFIYDSITTAASDTVSGPVFSQYDAILIIHAGVGEESYLVDTTPNDLWSLYYNSGTLCPADTSKTCICQNASNLNSCLTTTLKDGNPVSE